MATKKQLESIGLLEDSTPLKKDRWYHPRTNHHVSNCKSRTLDHIVNELCDVSIDHGVEVGKQRKLNEFRNFLGFNDIDNTF